MAKKWLVLISIFDSFLSLPISFEAETSAEDTIVATTTKN
jgi:hypothetical protein